MKALSQLVAVSSVAAVAISDCPGYKASNVVRADSSITADLTLASAACNIYGTDIRDLKLLVEYQTDKRLHVNIYDAGLEVYQVQESILPRPVNQHTPEEKAALQFSLTEEPFSFSIVRSATGTVLFNTSGTQLIFESQYVRLQTSLPNDPNLYGLGEHSDSFRLPTINYTRTLWNTDGAYLPPGNNLYGSHPIYLDHRGSNGTHGVFLMNANGMDIKINQTSQGQYLEYNIIGGVLDFYFLAGPSPSEVSQQYAEVVGLPAFTPYWSLGFHQCKYGYMDVLMVAEVVANYSTANIPLEVMWIDIDGMDQRQDFTVDPERFPLKMMRELISTLHQRDQYFVTMLDPGIHLASNYSPYIHGEEAGAFLKAADGSDYRGIQWPGEVVWPDFLSQNAREWWTDEILHFFDPETGLDVDGLWNDMNEVDQFCGDIDCDPSTATEPVATSVVRNSTGRPIPGFPADFQPQSQSVLGRKNTGTMKGLSGRDLFTPLYRINNRQGNLSSVTLWTNITNADGTVQYDTHNLYGVSMATATRNALISRRPSKRPFVLTRSTFSGAGTKAAHWFGDDASTWVDYRISIAQMLAFTAIHQMPMVGTDVCGFNEDATELMCARWAALGAFMPFYRNHANIASIQQEFYQWPLVAAAARRAISARYRLLDYLYTAMYQAVSSGRPMMNPLLFIYPGDVNTFGIELQFFAGDAILVSPVTDDNSTSVTFYLPNDTFYDFWTLERVEGLGATVTLDNVNFTSIPVHIRGGTILPLRSQSANTTAALRKNNFSIVVAPGLNGQASGLLYLDDGESLDVMDSYSDISFSWDGNTFSSGGTFGYPTQLLIESITVLSEREPVTYAGPWDLVAPFSVTLNSPVSALL